MFWCIWKKILHYLSSQKLMCVLKKHMQTTVFLVCLEAQDRFSGSSRKKGEMRDSFLYGERMGGGEPEWCQPPWSSAGRKQKQVQRGAKTPCWVLKLPRLFLHFHHTPWGSGSDPMPKGGLGAMKIPSSPRSPVSFDNWNFTGEVDETRLWWNHGTWSRYRYEKGEGGPGQ